MDPHEADLPVAVYCVLEAGRAKQTLYIQYVKGKEQNDYIPVVNAKIFMRDGWGRIIEFFHVENNVWQTADNPFYEIGTGTYVLYIEIAGRETLEAVTTVPERRTPTSYIITTDGSSEEDVASSDFYYKYDTDDNFYCPVWIVAVKGSHHEEEDITLRYTDIVTDHPNADSFTINGRKFSSLTIDGDPGRGSFLYRTWAAFKTMQHTMPDLPMYSGIVRIDQWDGRPFHMIAGPLRYKESYRDHFDYYFLSEELDLFLREAYIKDQSLDSNLTNVFSVENMYTNIRGGVGIFGSYNRDYVLLLAD